jgi:hypothetical protein
MATYAYYVGVYTYIHTYMYVHTYIVHVMYVSAHQSLLYFYLPRHPECTLILYILLYICEDSCMCTIAPCRVVHETSLFLTFDGDNRI